MSIIPNTTLQESLTRQINNNTNNIYVSCLAEVIQKLENGDFLCKVNIFNSKFDVKYQEELICTAYQDVYFHKPIKVGDLCFVIFTDYKQEQPNEIVENIKTIKHQASNGKIVAVIEKYNDNDDNLLTIDSKDKKIKIMNNTGQMGTILNDLKTTITVDLKELLTSGSASGIPVVFPNLENVISKLENNINSLLDILE